MHNGNHDLFLTALKAATLVCAIGAASSARTEGWSFNLGPAYRGGMDAKVSGPSDAAVKGVLAAKPAKGSVPKLGGDAVAAPVVDTDAGFTFDNGSIGPNSGGFAVATGGTYADGEYTFKKTVMGSGVKAGSSVSRSVSTDSAGMTYDDDDFDAVGLRAELSRDLGGFLGLDAGVTLGLRAFLAMEAELGGQGYNQTVTEKSSSWSGSPSSSTFTYAFTAAGGGDYGYIETDGYEMTGGETGVSGGSVLTGSKSSSWGADSKVSMDVDANLYQAALDIFLGATLADGLQIGIRPALLLNLASVEVDRSEVFSSAKGVVSSWEESGDADEFAVGFGLEGSVEVALDETWSLIGTAGYEIIDTVEVDVGPSKVEIDFSGYVLSLMLGTAF